MFPPNDNSYVAIVEPKANWIRQRMLYLKPEETMNEISNGI